MLQLLYMSMFCLGTSSGGRGRQRSASTVCITTQARGVNLQLARCVLSLLQAQAMDSATEASKHALLCDTCRQARQAATLLLLQFGERISGHTSRPTTRKYSARVKPHYHAFEHKVRVGGVVKCWLFFGRRERRFFQPPPSPLLPAGTHLPLVRRRFVRCVCWCCFLWEVACD